MRSYNRIRKAFTLVELLVVIAILALLLGILLPVIGRARLQAKLVAVNAELRDIGLALEAYALDHEGAYPPTRIDCTVGDHFYQLPCELVDSGYLPAAPAESFLAAGFEDRFNRGYTYKYRSVGPLIYNRTQTTEHGAALWVPDGFPDNEQETGHTFNSSRESPVSWALYSQGPNFDLDRMRQLEYPVPQRSWYTPETGDGVIVLIRLLTGRQVGSYEN
jgi:prepilin-type N-terminal cleavage/methylation domain-containing protein